jgi:hypothetical protein
MYLWFKSRLLFINFFFQTEVYTQLEQEAIVDSRNEAASKKIAQIENDTQAAILALVINLIPFFWYHNALTKRCQAPF